MKHDVIETGWGYGQLVEVETGVVRYYGPIERCRLACDFLDWLGMQWAVTTRAGHSYTVKADGRDEARRAAQLHIWQVLKVADHPVSIEPSTGAA